MKKCPRCGYIHNQRPKGRPKKYTDEEIKKMKKLRGAMTLQEVANKLGCAIGTVQRYTKIEKKIK